MKTQSGVRRNYCLIPVFARLRERIISSNIPVSSLSVNKVITHLGPDMKQFSKLRRSTFSRTVNCIINILRRKSARKSGGRRKSRANDSESRIVPAEAEPLQRCRAADNSSKNSNTSVSNDSSTPTLDFEISGRAHNLLQPPVDDQFQEINAELNLVLL